MRQYLVVLMTLVISACSSGGGNGDGQSSSGPDVNYGWPEAQIEWVLSGLNLPTSYVSPNDGTVRMFATEQQSGKVMINKDGTLLPTPFLDIADRIIKPGSLESGLLSIAFSPNYKENGYFYLNYVGLEHKSIISRFKVTDNPDIADPNSEEKVLTIEERNTGGIHYGGQMAFGPDGYLYIASGDASGDNPPDSDNVGQNKNSLLGKILRIDVENQKTYAIPSDNPFAGQAGARGEVWAYGLRNPWRFSFDSKTGDLFIGDVGNAQREAVYFQSASSGGGENYGWSVLEGSSCLKPELGCEQEEFIQPIIEYPHGERAVSINGGYVYRGPGNCRMKGKYFYSDYLGKIWAAVKVGNVWETKLLIDLNENLFSYYLSSFGVDEKGMLYIVVHWRGAENDGEIYRIIDPAGPQDCG